MEIEKSGTNFNLVNQKLNILLQTLSKLAPTENIFISPTSIFLALALLTEGLSGETRSQCVEFFGFDPKEVITKEDMEEIQRIFSLESDHASLNIANSAWVNQIHGDVKPQFRMRIIQHYKASVEKLNFFDKASTKIINDYIEEKTQGMIKNVIQELKPEDVLLLVNTIFFSGKWFKPFKPANDVTQFHLTETEEVKAEFIREKMTGGYLKTQTAIYFTLDYKGAGVSFVACMPLKGFDPISCFDPKEATEVFNSRREMIVTMPKFEFETDYELSEVLIKLGCDKIFKASDDFKGIMDGNIMVSQVIHKAKISVDENGTKAAAATVVRMLKGCARRTPQEPKKVTLDRPFVFCLVENDSNLILFSGVVMNPVA